jgi:DNA polymerase-3 subunit gamma/tau
MDVLEIDAASNTGVDDIRTLRENIRYLPAGGKKRIYIIDEVHRLSGSAFDALLKTLEEPPSHVLFVFATTEPLKVPETILSRTQRFDFRRVSVEELAKPLGNIATKEEIAITDAALHLLARKADGSVRDSLSLMDQIVAFSGEKIDEPEVVQALGLIDRAFLFGFVDAVAASDRKQALRLTNQVIENGIDVGDFAEELLEHLRILMILQSDPEASGALSLTPTELTEYQKQAEFFQVGDILRLMNMIVDLNNGLKSGLDERLLIEVTAIKMASMESTVKLSELLDKLSSGAPLPAAPTANGPQNTPARSNAPELFTSLTVKRAAVIPPRPAPAAVTSQPTVQPQQSWPNKPLNLPQVQAGWEGFLTNFRQNFPMLASQLRMAEITAVKENQVQLMFYSAGEASRQLVQKPENTQTIIGALRDYYRANVTVRFDIDLSKEYPTGFAEQPAGQKIDPAKLVENSPRLQKLLTKVDGEIIGIKKVEP